MSFVLLSKMAKLKFNHIRHTIISTQKSTTIMPGISQLLNNRLIGKEFSSAVPTMFKREDYKLTIHDIAFSKWRNLIRHNDWKDFNNRKERVRRYRHEDLPPQRCTGLYELGVGVIGQDQGQNFDPDNNVLGVYVGQCVDVKSRLQDYGRRGGHLPSGLYEDIFSEGYSVFYRWAPEAAATEGMLLSTFDYAWNTCSNGERRHLELQKLGDPEFMSKRKSQVLVPSIRDQVVTIKVEKSNYTFLTSTLKVMRPFG